jgi:hypothetical protein
MSPVQIGESDVLLAGLADLVGVIQHRGGRDLAATRAELRIVADQRGAPTSSAFLAEATARALAAIPFFRSSC